MACELDDSIAWTALLTARTLLQRGARRLALIGGGGSWSCIALDAGDVPTDAAQVLRFGLDAATPLARTHGAWTDYTPAPNGRPEFAHPTGQPVDAALLAAARVYLPVLLGAAAARTAGRTFTVAHVTQTLDGRIACLSGHSQWIGNAADLRHAHRMRALLDAVMVGSGTALADDPRLTVRLVDGPNPRRIVVSGSGRVVTQGGRLRLFEGDGAEIVVAANCTVTPPVGATQIVPVAATGACLAPADVLAALRARGIASIYLEGGSVTLSSFLAARQVDLLQVHVAPMVLGSGIPSFALPAVDHLDGASRFAMDHAALDGHLLLSCWPVDP